MHNAFSSSARLLVTDTPRVVRGGGVRRTTSTRQAVRGASVCRGVDVGDDAWWFVVVVAVVAVGAMVVDIWCHSCLLRQIWLRRRLLRRVRVKLRFLCVGPASAVVFQVCMVPGP